jgi:ParB family chromosome partitioning protein
MAEHTTVRLADLFIDNNVNVRKVNRGAEPIFTGTIRRRGVLQPLIVRRKDRKLAITDGGKRYEALCWLRDHTEAANGKPVTNDYQVPVEITDESDAEAKETSLILNVARSDTHPVDRFERFSELVKDGATVEAIANTYGMPVREVEKALALGALHPTILSAWRAGEIRAEIAQTYTLSQDKALQEKAFEKLKKSRSHNSRHWIRHELKAQDQEVGHLLELVGRDSYEARGGKVTAFDLFEKKHTVSNTDLLAEMAKEKVAEECKRLVALGWGWAAPGDDLPPNWNWKFGKLNPKVELTQDEKAQIERLRVISEDEELSYSETERADIEVTKIEEEARRRAFGPKQMAKSGCAIEISDTGELQITYGLIKPDNAKIGEVIESEEFEEKRKDRAKADKKKAPSLELSNALVHRLSVQMTAAAEEAIHKHPNVALDIAIAALLSGGKDYGPGVQIIHSGHGSHKARGSFKSLLESVEKMKLPKKLDALAGVIGLTFDFQSNDAAALGRFKATGLLDRLGKEMVAAMRKVFDAEDYFNSVPKAICLAAITEAINSDEARKIGGKPKADIAKFAIANVPKTGWLPRELRTAHYDGPAAKAKKRAA